MNLLISILSLFTYVQEYPFELDSLKNNDDNHEITIKPKILHAEPLYIDLIRDLGARKGEQEWNVGWGMFDRRNYDKHEALIEYEWAPIDRLGFEVELPFSFYSKNGSHDDNRPSNRVESIKLATQWSFLVAPKIGTTLALGYIHEFEFVDIKNIQWSNLFKGNVYNPFFVAAKNWGNRYHTLLYTGPSIGKEFGKRSHISYQINSSIHYMLLGSRNFIGVEVNQVIDHGRITSVLRPQMRLDISDQLMVGIVTGVPLQRMDEGLSTFLRIVYEPSHKY
ncbi:HAEPLYID family protein [Belliella aquatica]|uniref:Phosphoribosylformylglycinamidine synthase n=1 Tax=Belliella aquatica TaxID=1323734 RepID=A0ABQ1N5Z8_9BACT|nr:HAEPLYID family protein [Belliella aquatica]MCH7407667.1 phosphoribosylformylglycinamidine synthase [Belliella aquatica]GGC55240.1 hypothetical protein GCM10010993_36950 [Belliella aquatica]